MDPEEYSRIYRAEDRHWWYLGMAAVTHAVLRRTYPAGGKLRILDAGCGTGGAMQNCLAEFGQIWGIDPAPEAAAFCRKRGLRTMARADVVRLPFPGRSFELVTSFDVLYIQGIPSELDALREIRRMLTPGGRLLLRLPAYEWMRRSHDRAVATRRRYTRGEVASLLRQSGFLVEWTTYANTILLPAAMARKAWEAAAPRSEARSDLALDPGPWNGLLRFLLSLEAPFAARIGIPFGLSVFAVGRNP